MPLKSRPCREPRLAGMKIACAIAAGSKSNVPVAPVTVWCRIMGRAATFSAPKSATDAGETDKCGSPQKVVMSCIPAGLSLVANNKFTGMVKK